MTIERQYWRNHYHQMHIEIETYVFEGKLTVKRKILRIDQPPLSCNLVQKLIQISIKSLKLQRVGLELTLKSFVAYFSIKVRAHSSSYSHFFDFQAITLVLSLFFHFEHQVALFYGIRYKEIRRREFPNVDEVDFQIDALFSHYHRSSKSMILKFIFS